MGLLVRSIALFGTLLRYQSRDKSPSLRWQLARRYHDHYPHAPIAPHAVQNSQPSFLMTD
jgi:hypothetical protein